MIKLSSLKSDEIVIDENSNIIQVEDVINDLELFKHMKLYTTTQYYAKLDAKHAIEMAIDDECDNMYEDWNDRILEGITKEDIQTLQNLLDNIMSKNESINISYIQDKKIEI